MLMRGLVRIHALVVPRMLWRACMAWSADVTCHALCL